MKFSWSIILLLIVLMATVVTSNSEHRRRRHQRRKDYRKIRSAADCGPHEEFTTCGPEPQCEKSCDNLFSPPRCQADYTNPRCYYPRCICKPGYVRDSDGRRCTPEWRCKIQEKLKRHEKHQHHRHHASPAAQKLLASKDGKRDYFLFPQAKNTNWW